MPLIEIIKGEKTSDSVVQKMFELTKAVNKTPIIVNDCRGFLVNRILMTYLNEAVLLLEEGAQLDKIDKALFDFGLPMGPFTLLDEIGIKVSYKVAKNLVSAYPERSEMGHIFSEIASKDDILGRANGKGFFVYKNKNKKINPKIIKILKDYKVEHKSIDNEDIVDRCILRMINEASICLDENIVESPGRLDMALILGTGFPPFRGGILKYADFLGMDKIIQKLKIYESKYGKRFAPSSFLNKMFEKKERFYK